MKRLAMLFPLLRDQVVDVLFAILMHAQGKNITNNPQYSTSICDAHTTRTSAR